MDGTVITRFVIATFFGSLTTGLTGFAAGLVVSGIWLHILTPVQSAVLIAAYGVANQAQGIWKVRRALQWRRILPLVLGAALGIPFGAWLVTYLNPAHIRVGIGVFLLLAYSTYNLARPHFTPVEATRSLDFGVGILNGLGAYGIGGRHQHDLVPARRRLEGSAARDFPAGGLHQHGADYGDVRRLGSLLRCVHP